MKYVKNFAVIGLVLSCALAQAACTTQVQYHLIDTGCMAFRPVITEHADVDVISDSLARQLLTHNRMGAERCGWGRQYEGEEDDGLL